VSLRVKFALFAAVLALLIAAQGVVSYDRERRNMVEAAEERALVLARTLADSAREPLASSRYSLLDTQAQAILAERDAAFARVLDARGRIVADTRREYVGWSISGEAQGTLSVSTAAGLLVARAPIVIPGRANGTAEVALRLAPLWERLARSRGVLLRFALAELAACAVFLALLSIELLQPVQALTRELEEAPASGLPRPVSLPRAAGPEVRRIAKALDELRSRVAEYQAELIAEERLATIGKMAAEVAHEVRNPLEAISGAAELLARGDTSGAFVDVIREEVRALDAYLTGILEFARSGATVPETAELGTLLAETVALAGSMAREADVAIRFEAGPCPLPCFVDRTAMKRACFNLLANAIEASPRGSSVAIRHERIGDTLRVRILDAGSGLSRESRLRAFEPYYTTKERGTGLGLALVKRIVEAHGGRVYFEEPDGNQDGAGAVIAVELPAAGSAC
jgi:signal transduction histidine kinase